MTITDTDMRNQVAETISGSEGNYDVNGIVADIQGEYGTVDIDDVPSERFWKIVLKHEI